MKRQSAKPSAEKYIGTPVPLDLLASLDEIAKRRDRSRAWLIRAAIENLIKQEVIENEPKPGSAQAGGTATNHKGR
jgi:predicted transcriptional regulator